jgi:hypothetical protein
MRRLDSLETAKKEAFKKALGPQQTKRSAEANLASGNRVENSVLTAPSSTSYAQPWRIRVWMDNSPG